VWINYILILSSGNNRGTKTIQSAFVWKYHTNTLYVKPLLVLLYQSTSGIPPSRTALVWESRRLAKDPDSISMTSVELCFAPLRSSCSGTISPHPSFTSLSACIAYILTFSPIMRHQRKCHHVLYVIFSCVTFEKCHFIFSDCKLNCLYVTQTLR